MTVDPEERVMEGGPARYGAAAQGGMAKFMKECAMDTPDVIIPSVFDPALADDRYPSMAPERPYQWTEGKRRPIYMILSDINDRRNDIDRLIDELIDHTNGTKE